MRRLFKQALLEYAKSDDRIVLLTGDLGYGMFDEFQTVLPKQYVNCGAAEQAMLDIAVGLSYHGKIPVAYSITPFLLYRPFETLRTYIAHEKLHVILAGSGRDRDYLHDGYSHDARDVRHFLRGLDIRAYYPVEKEKVPAFLREAIDYNGPSFISLRR